MQSKNLTSLRIKVLLPKPICLLCLDMLEASQQKYKYNNFQIKLNNYSDWITYQSSQNRKIPLEKLINDKELKHLGTGTFITFDSVHIAQNKFLDSLFHTNIN